MELLPWAERVMAVSESGETAEKIRLQTTDGQTWETWTGPFRSAQAWCAECEQVLFGLMDDWPATDIQIMIVAENREGHIIAQTTKRVKGRQKGANANMFGGPGKALADSMDAQARTMDRILKTAEGQLTILTTALEAAQQQNLTLIEQMKMMHVQSLETRPTVDPDLLHKGLDMLPGLIEMIVSDGKVAS